MSDGLIKFKEEELDGKEVMMLEELGRVLLKNEETEVKMQKLAQYNRVENVLIRSWFW